MIQVVLSSTETYNSEKTTPKEAISEAQSGALVAIRVQSSQQTQTLISATPAKLATPSPTTDA